MEGVLREARGQRAAECGMGRDKEGLEGHPGVCSLSSGCWRTTGGFEAEVEVKNKTVFLGWGRMKTRKSPCCRGRME